MTAQTKKRTLDEALLDANMKAGELNAGLKLAEMAQNRSDSASATADYNRLMAGGGASLGNLGSGASAQPQAGGQTLANLGAGSPPRPPDPLSRPPS